MRIIFAGVVKVGNYPEIYVPLGGTGLAARRLRGSAVLGCLHGTIRKWEGARSQVEGCMN